MQIRLIARTALFTTQNSLVSMEFPFMMVAHLIQ
jgi:hypothetical protein